MGFETYGTCEIRLLKWWSFILQVQVVLWYMCVNDYICVYLEMLMFVWHFAVGVDPDRPTHPVGSHHWLLYQKLGERLCVCVCVCVCMCVCMCVCVCVCMCVSVYNVMFMFVYVCVSLHGYVRIHECVCVCVCVCMYDVIFMFMCVCVCICVNLLVYVRIHESVCVCVFVHLYLYVGVCEKIYTCMHSCSLLMTVFFFFFACPCSPACVHLELQ